MAKTGPLPLALKASTQIGVVSIPRPPPKPAFEKPMNKTPIAARTVVVTSNMQPEGRRPGAEFKRQKRLNCVSVAVPKAPSAETISVAKLVATGLNKEKLEDVGTTKVLNYETVSFLPLFFRGAWFRVLAPRRSVPIY